MPDYLIMAERPTEREADRLVALARTGTRMAAGYLVAGEVQGATWTWELDAAGRLLAEPPMQGTIRAIWTLGLSAAAKPIRLQLVQGDETATAAFEPAADCAALPAAAVKRLSGG